MTPAEITTILYRLDKQDEVLGEIQHHVSKTNGRVMKLEIWQARVIGAVAVLAFLLSAVALPVLVAVL
jgi:hypothetical protein